MSAGSGVETNFPLTLFDKACEMYGTFGAADSNRLCKDDNPAPISETYHRNSRGKLFCYIAMTHAKLFLKLRHRLPLLTGSALRAEPAQYA